ncbi:low temperature requirement protein A [Plantactinospora sp. WMMC1484]|uniref:low temperature requirement protein A n=1 Tax=Plantactinospora sp. WMMC1484 TaxID=3404122 RepID=UPI003BF50FD6
MAADDDGGATEPVHETPNRPALLELFFDLAFVFVLILLTTRLFDELTWVNAGQTLILLLAFALLWALTAWAGDLLSPALLLPRAIGSMVGILLMGATVMDAYGSRGLLFAATYVGVTLGTGLYMRILGPPALRLRTVRIFCWFVLSSAGWLAGGTLSGTARGALWAAAITIEYVGATLGWPVPGSWRRVPRHNQRLVGERIAERYRQFVIVALGVSIYVTGSAFTTTTYTMAHTVALVVVFAVKVMIWRIYIGGAGELMAATIARSADPIRLSQLTALLHLVMVAGIIGTAVTSKLVIGRPFGDTPGSWTAVVVGGPMLFLIGRGALGYIVFARVSWAFVIGLPLLAALAAAAPLVPPVALALGVLIILTGVAVQNTVSWRRRPLVPTVRGR